MEVLFDAMALRTFTYNFNFAPKNEQEAYEVQKDYTNIQISHGT